MKPIFERANKLLNHNNLIPTNKRKLSDNFFLVTITSILVAWLTTYFTTEHNRNKSFCIQEIKDFNIKEFSYKDISILNKECSSYVKEYSLYEDILYSKNTKNSTITNFASIINELYAHKKITKDTILNFSDIYLNGILGNDEYKYKNYIESTKYNKREIDYFISNYLLFKANLDYEITEYIEIVNFYNISQVFSNYIHLFNKKEFKSNVFPSLTFDKATYKEIDMEDIYSIKRINFFESNNNYKLYKLFKEKIPYKDLIKHTKNISNTSVLIKLFKAINNENVETITDIVSEPLNNLFNTKKVKLNDIPEFQYATYFFNSIYQFKLLMNILSDSKIDIKKKKLILTNLIKNSKLPKKYFFETGTFYNEIFETIYQFSYDNDLLTNLYFEYIKDIRLRNDTLRIISFNENYHLLYKLFKHTSDERYKKEIYEFLVNIFKKETLKENSFEKRDLKEIIYEIFETTKDKSILTEYAFLSLKIDSSIYPEIIDYFLKFMNENSKLLINTIENRYLDKHYGKDLLFETILNLNNKSLLNTSLKFELLNKIKPNSKLLR